MSRATLATFELPIPTADQFTDEDRAGQEERAQIAEDKGQLRLTDVDIASLEACTSSREWDVVCDDIKDAYSGYPEDWYLKVVMSGLMSRVSSHW